MANQAWCLNPARWQESCFIRTRKVINVETYITWKLIAFMAIGMCLWFGN